MSRAMESASLCAPLAHLATSAHATGARGAQERIRILSRSSAAPLRGRGFRWVLPGQGPTALAFAHMPACMFGVKTGENTDHNGGD
jgi:hypothetical protein